VGIGPAVLTADREKDKAWGNETIRWHPDEGWLEVKLAAPLAHLANRPHGRYLLSCPAEFCYRGDEVAAQAKSGAVRYDISHDPARGRWPAPKDGNGRAAGPRAAGAAGTSGAPSPASPPGNSAAGWSR
jgi:hypothetical protein